MSEKDAAVVECLEVIQDYELGPYSTHALLVEGVGASLHSLERHGSGSHLETYYMVAGPLITRLPWMGGVTPRKLAEQLLHRRRRRCRENGRRISC